MSGSGGASRLLVVTGGPGAGKTTLIDALAAVGVATSPEVGRAVIQGQVAAGGTALPWADRRAFAAAMMRAEVAAYRGARARGRPVVFDRGVPDVLGYLTLQGLAAPPSFRWAAAAARYAPVVLIAPHWPDIYVMDAERRQSPAEARRTCTVMVETYSALGYDMRELPLVPTSRRVAFVREVLVELCGKSS